MSSLLDEGEQTVNYLQQREILNDMTSGIMGQFYKSQGLNVSHPKLPRTHVTDQMIQDYQRSQLFDKEGNVMVQDMPPPLDLDEIPEELTAILHGPSPSSLRERSINPFIHQLEANERRAEELQQQYLELEKKYNLEEGFVKRYGDNRRAKALRDNMTIIRDELISLEQEREQLQNQITFEEQNLRRYEQERDNAERDIQTIKQRNKDKERAYEDAKRNVSRTAIKKEIGESQEDYEQRLEETHPDAFQVLQRSKEFLFQDLKKLFNDIIRNRGTVELLLNTIKHEPDGEAFMLRLKNSFPLIKTQFEKSFGKTNEFVDLPIRDLLIFLRNIIFKKSGIVEQETPLSREEFRYGMDELREAIKPEQKRKLELGEEEENIFEGFFEGLTPISEGYQKMGELREPLITASPSPSPIIAEPVRGRPPSSKTTVKSHLKNTYGSFEAMKEKLEETGRSDILFEYEQSKHPPRKDQFISWMTDRNEQGLKSGDDPVLHLQRTYGLGLHNYARFGKIHLNPSKLQEESILSVRDGRGYALKGFPNARVSSVFSDAILLHGGKISKEQHKKMSIEERQLFDELINVAGMKSKTHTSSDKTIEDLKKRLQLVIGEAEAGNNSPELAKEYGKLLKRLAHFKVISLGQVDKNVREFKKMQSEV